MHELQRTQQFKITSLFSASRKSPGFEDHHTSALNAAAMPQKDPLKKKKTRGERQIDPYSSPAWDLFFFFFFTQAGNPVNILDEQNWDQYSVGVPCAYTGLLHYHHPSMQSGTEYLFRDHLSTSPHRIKIPSAGERAGCLRRRDCNIWNNFTASPRDNAFTEDKRNFSRFPLVPLAVCCSCQGSEIRSVFFFFFFPSSFLHLLLRRLLPFFISSFRPIHRADFCHVGEFNDITAYNRKNK